MFAKTQISMEEHMMHAPHFAHTPTGMMFTVGAPNKLFFLTMNEVKYDMKCMNENTK